LSPDFVPVAAVALSGLDLGSSPVDEKLVLELAAAGQLPGRRLGDEWRFSHAAIMGWLG
jgi:hypothetical protein